MLGEVIFSWWPCLVLPHSNLKDRWQFIVSESSQNRTDLLRVPYENFTTQLTLMSIKRKFQISTHLSTNQTTALDFHMQSCALISGKISTYKGLTTVWQKEIRSSELKLPGIIQLARFPVRDICIAPKIVTSTLPPLIMAKLSSLEK